MGKDALTGRSWASGCLIWPRLLTIIVLSQSAVRRRRELYVDQADKDLQELVATGKAQGYLTYDQVNEYLPDEAVNPDKLDNLLMALEDQGIELVNEPPEVDFGAPGGSERFGRRPPFAPYAARKTRRRSKPRGCGSPDDTARWSDDPVRMYLTQMAEIPLLSRDEEIALAKKIEVTRKRFRRTLLACDLAMRVHDRDADQSTRRLAPLRSHDQGVADRAVDQRADHGADAAQPADARTSAQGQPPGLPPHDRPQLAAGRSPRGPRPVPEASSESVDAGRGIEPAHAPRAAADSAVGRHLAIGCSRSQARIAQLDNDTAAKDERANLRKELRDAMMLTLEGPATLQPPLREDADPVPGVRKGQARAVGRQPAAGGVDRQEVPQPRA